MGEAPKIIEGLTRTKKQVREDEQEWELRFGELDPTKRPDEEPELRPQSIPVPEQTWD